MSVDGDCAPGEICRNNRCEEAPPECVRDTDCDVGQVCVNGTCENAPAGCRGDVDCGAGQICEAGQCQVGCRRDNQCPVGQFCDDGECAEVPECREAQDIIEVDRNGAELDVDTRNTPANYTGSCAGRNEQVLKLVLNTFRQVRISTSGNADNFQVDPVIYVEGNAMLGLRSSVMMMP